MTGQTVDAAEEGLRERKKRERQQALRRAAVELTLEKGFAGVTIEDICDRCGVSRRTFFNYFGNKEEAILGRADSMFDESVAPTIAEFEAGGPAGALLPDLEHLLATVVRSRLSNRDQMAQYHRILRQEPTLMQVQMTRMGNNERLFREMIQRRLDTDAGVPAAVGPDAAATRPESEPHSSEHHETEEPVSPRAEALAALAMMAVRATFARLRRSEGDPAPVVHELFAELRTLFTDDAA